MRKEHILTVLWIIFGFVFIIAIESILYLIINLLYFGSVELGISFGVMTYIFPILTLILYSLTVFLLLKRLEVKPIKLNLEPSAFPKKLLIILGITVVILTPLTEKLSDIYTDSILDNDQIRLGEYFLFLGSFKFGFTFSEAIVLIFLIVYLFKNLKNYQDQL